jgi:pimeloyl-ACP methyl ester carboxylesterase
MNLTTTVDGFDVTLRRLTGPEPTLVLIHGAGRNHLAWDEVLPRIGGLDMVIPSLPGRCGSEGSPLPNVGEAAAWLRKLLLRIGLSQVVVAGHSYGGAVALEYALSDGDHTDPRKPELAGLALISTGARLRVKQSLLDELEDAANAGIHVNMVDELYQRDSDPAIVRREETAATRTPPEVALVDWQAANVFDRMEDLGKVRVPTLVIGGTADEHTPPKYAEYLAENIDGAVLELVEGAGHMLPFERHDTLALKLHDFVKGLSPDAEGESER